MCVARIGDFTDVGMDRRRILYCLSESCYQHFIVQLIHTSLKNVELLEHFKIRKLLQRVSVYKETIVREPPTLLC